MFAANKVHRAHGAAMRHITAAAAASGFHANGNTGTAHPQGQSIGGKPGTQGTRAERLDWAPQLTWTDELCCVLVSAGLCILTYVLTAPPAFSVTYAAGIAVLCGTLIWAMRGVLVERQYQAMARQFSELGDKDSRFLRLGDLDVHAKADASEGLMQRLEGFLKRSQPPPVEPAGTAAAKGKQRELEVVAMHCFHGFGANLYSYAPVQANLARALDGLVSSHDMPGFGLTQRPSNTASYFLSFNGQLGSQLIDKELSRVVEQCESSLHATAFKGSDQQGPPAASGVAQQQAVQAASVKGSGGLEKAGLAPIRAGVRSFDGGLAQRPGAWAGGREADGLERAPSPISVLHGQPSTDSDSSVDMDFLEDAPFGTGAAKQGRASISQTSQPLQSGSALTQPGTITASLPNPAAAEGPSLLVKKVLIGHSLGGICAALAALDQPEACAALVLVAPAIMALPDKQSPMTELQPWPVSGNRHGPQSYPITLDEEEEEGEGVPGGAPSGGKQQTRTLAATSGLLSQTGQDVLETGGAKDGLVGLPPGLVDRYTCPEDGEEWAAPLKQSASGGVGGRLVRVVVVLGQALLLLVGLLVLTAFKPAIVAVLRTLVRSKTFWQRGLQQAYYNPGQVTDEVVDAYRLPQLVRGWESGMFMFLTARLAATVDLRAVGDGVTGLMSSVEKEVAEDAGLAKRLGWLVRKHRTPILIIHGIHDKLVPASNSRRLATMLPGCELALLQRCGHMPQEEWPRPFVELIREFVTRRAHSGVKMPLHQAA